VSTTADANSVSTQLEVVQMKEIDPFVTDFYPHHPTLDVSMKPAVKPSKTQIKPLEMDSFNSIQPA